MTCGACHPKAFRTKGGGRVFGYVVARDPSSIAHETGKLMYLAAKHIFADLPHGNVRYRKGLQRLRKVMRPGDRLILATDNALGLTTSRRGVHFNALEADGVEVFTLRQDYFGQVPWVEAAP